ncbi:MAG: tetratricopeptide repeat protein [Verrucomicrobiales bacterium]
MKNISKSRARSRFIAKMASLAVLIVAGVAAYVIWLKPSTERTLRRGNEYYQAGQIEEAKIEYMNVLRKERTNATALAQLGIIWMDQGAPIRAYGFLSEAKKADPSNLKALISLSRVQRALGRVDDAKAETLEILKRSPRDVDSTVFLAESAVTEEEVKAVKKQFSDLGVPEDGVGFLLASAIFDIRKDALEEAATAIEKALAIAPKSDLAHIARGNLYLKRKDVEKAGESFKTASSLAPRLSTTRLRHASFQLQTGKIDEAKATLDKITADVPDFLAAWELRAQIALRENNPDQALSLLENVLSQDPIFLGGRLLQALALLAKGGDSDIDKAVRGLEDLRIVYPNNSVIEYQLARAYLAQKDLAKASAALSLSLAANPTNLEATMLLSQLNLRSGNPAAVVSAMEEVSKTYPAFTKAELLLADAYRATGRLNDAADVFRKQIARDATAFQPHLALGMILRQQEKLAEARLEFEKAQTLGPENALALYQLAELDLVEQKYDVALERLRPELDIPQRAATAHFMVGRVHAAQGNWASSETVLLKALESEPNFTQAYNLLIAGYVATNKLDQAIGQVEDILQQKPDDVSALLKAGMIYQQMGKLEKARDSYERATVINPNMAAPLNNLAWLYSEQLNEPEKAFEAAQKARTLQPEEGAIADTLGWIIYKSGDFPRALPLIQEAASKLPDNSEVQHHLGMASYRMGQIDQARAALEKAVASATAFPGKEEARAQLTLIASLPDLKGEALAAALREHPDDAILQLQSAEQSRYRGDYQAAVTACLAALETRPDLAPAHLLLAEIYAGPLPDPAAAMKAASNARALAPGDPKVAAVLGSIALRDGDAERAYGLLKDAAVDLPSDTTVLYDLASAAFVRGNVGEAQQALNQLLASAAADPASTTRQQDAKSFLALLSYLHDRQESAAAEAVALQLLEKSLQSLPARMVLAAAQADRGETEKAMAAYKEILEKSPDFVLAQKELATLYALAPDQAGAAYDLASKARTVLDNDIELNWTFAQLNLERDTPYALQLLKEIAANSKPGTAREWFFYGRALQELGENSKAIAAFTKTIEAGPQSPLAEEAKAHLQDLP